MRRYHARRAPVPFWVAKIRINGKEREELIQAETIMEAFKLLHKEYPSTKRKGRIMSMNGYSRFERVIIAEPK